MRMVLKICSICSLTALISCSSSGQSKLTAPSASPAQIPANAEVILPTAAPTATAAPKTKLIHDLSYSGEEMILSIAGKDYPATFVKIDLHPYGFYIPDSMQEFMYEDGSEVGLNKSEFISLTEVERLTDPENPHESLRFGGDVLFMDEDLAQYEEYIGSARDGNEWRRTDGFIFRHDSSPAMMIYFSYFSRNKETVLPVFLEVARNIKYMD